MAKKLDVKEQEVIYVGDSDVDIKTAHNAGFLGVGVSWGFRGVQELKESGADAVVDYPQQILNFFQQIVLYFHDCCNNLLLLTYNILNNILQEEKPWQKFILNKALKKIKTKLYL